MSTDSWSKNEIKKLAVASGKPLEVQCAEAFLRAGWGVRLGTYFHDVSSEKVRELDVLIENTKQFEGHASNRDVIQWKVCLRILGSCKGFPSECEPATYSMSASSNTVHRPCFMYYSRGPFGVGATPSMGHHSASRVLNHANLTARQVVGFDIFERELRGKRKDEKSPALFEYKRKTDKDLFEGLDSAIKAAVYWDQQDRNQWGGNNIAGYAALHIPLLVSAHPFWDVLIDGGLANEPEVKHHGYHVGLYPFSEIERRAKPITSIIWSAPKLDELTTLMGDLFEYFVDEVRLATR